MNENEKKPTKTETGKRQRSPIEPNLPPEILEEIDQTFEEIRREMKAEDDAREGKSIR